jgi:hypothetical protein
MTATADTTRKRQEQCEVAQLVRQWPVKSPAVRNELRLYGICPDCGSDAPEHACGACGWKDTERRRE